jgi:hypothetical protein
MVGQKKRLKMHEAMKNGKKTRTGEEVKLKIS